MTGLLLVITYVIARRRGFGGSGRPFAWRPFLDALWAGKWAIGTPVLILGGIYGGIFTPTEAAGVAVFYALVIGCFVYRELTWRKIIDSLRFTALMTGLLILLAPTIAFGQLAAFFDVPAAVEGAMTSVTRDSYIVMVLIGFSTL